jgi:hypothetical protein
MHTHIHPEELIHFGFEKESGTLSSTFALLGIILILLEEESESILDFHPYKRKHGRTGMQQPLFSSPSCSFFLDTYIFYLLSIPPPFTPPTECEFCIANRYADTTYHTTLTTCERNKQRDKQGPVNIDLLLFGYIVSGFS